MLKDVVPFDNLPYIVLFVLSTVSISENISVPLIVLSSLLHAEKHTKNKHEKNNNNIVLIKKLFLIKSYSTIKKCAPKDAPKMLLSCCYTSFLTKGERIHFT